VALPAVEKVDLGQPCDLDNTSIRSSRRTGDEFRSARLQDLGGGDRVARERRRDRVDRVRDLGADLRAELSARGRRVLDVVREDVFDAGGQGSGQDADKLLEDAVHGRLERRVGSAGLGEARERGGVAGLLDRVRVALRDLLESRDRVAGQRSDDRLDRRLDLGDEGLLRRGQERAEQRRDGVKDGREDRVRKDADELCAFKSVRARKGGRARDESSPARGSC
jgi:hypothetical protein